MLCTWFQFLAVTATKMREHNLLQYRLHQAKSRLQPVLLYTTQWSWAVLEHAVQGNYDHLFFWQSLSYFGAKLLNWSFNYLIMPNTNWMIFSAVQLVGNNAGVTLLSTFGFVVILSFGYSAVEVAFWSMMNSNFQQISQSSTVTMSTLIPYIERKSS